MDHDAFAHRKMLGIRGAATVFVLGLFLGAGIWSWHTAGWPGLPGSTPAAEARGSQAPRTVVMEPDEPTGTLDSGAAREVMELLVELNARDRITIVIITHDASIARRCARHTRLMDGVLREGPLGRP